jgi:membrane-associated HD superfamily phosphohydrolase
MKEEGDKAFANRNKIYEERNKIQEQLNLLYTRKRESVQAYKEASDRHWQKMNDERAKKAERLRAQRAAEEDEKKKEITDQLREEAHQPAFQAQIEDCQTLIDSLLRIAGGGAPSAPTAALNAPKSDLAGVPKLEKRTVEAPAEAGLIARKKKGEEEEAYFVGGKGKKKNAANKPTTPSSTSASQLNMPLPTLTALLSLSIPPPTSLTDIPRTVEDLKTKKAWFEANQARQTAENIAKAEKEIKKIESGQVVPAELKPEHLGEPAPTPAVNAPKENGVASEAVDQRLDQVQE